MSDQMLLFSIPEHNVEQNHDKITPGKRRINSPIRNQMEFVRSSLDDLISEDHPVRNIWNYIEQMDSSLFLNKIHSTSCNPGRPATDPKLLLGLWIYAIVEGIGSARVIDRYCSEHLAFKWLCGGVSVNYHTISDFRRNNTKEFDELISQIIARLMHRDLITLNRVSQDGVRVRASAGASSYRRKPSLQKCLQEAKDQVANLEKELDQDTASCLNRQAAAKKRAAKERQERIEEALEEHRKSIIDLTNTKKKHRKKLNQEEKDEIRASTTDPKSRKMKMSNGGFNPAYNFQIAVDTESRIIVGSYVTNRGSDYGELLTMFNKVKDKFNKPAKQWLVDQGYLVLNDIIKAQKSGCKVYVNPKEKKAKNELHPGEDSELGEWRIRMGLDEAKEIYKDRAATSEWVNAGMRNRGLNRLLVRGRDCVCSVLNLHVLTHNIQRVIKLGYSY